jgi:serine/threonine-protein kinase
MIPPVETTVAGFRVRSLIGESDMALVYLAEEVATGRQVALKLLRPTVATDERFRQRFLRESQLAGGLPHPHVVATIASGEDESGALYLAMRYVDGSDLREILRREGPLEPRRAVALASQVADALDAAHAAGLVHRDVKPGNVLVALEAEGEHAYVCDFGLARHVSSVSSLTGDRGFVGTIDYVPPEQIEGKAIDGRGDVYSLGCLLYEALAGRRPFERDSELAVVFAHLNEPPPSATEARPELPTAFDEVFRRALAKDPDERYATCGELAAAARAALVGKVAPRRRRRRRLIALAAAGVAALAAAVVGAIVATNNSSSGPVAAPPKITESSIDGLGLGHTASYYAKTMNQGWKSSILSQPGFPEMSFQQPEVGVIFPKRGKRSFIITTWNRRFRTAAGIGPCSTLAQMHKVYGTRVPPAWAGSSHDGKKHTSWQLGRNLLFVTQDRRTISTVVLFKGVGFGFEAHNSSPSTWANYVGAIETACK